MTPQPTAVISNNQSLMENKYKFKSISLIDVSPCCQCFPLSEGGSSVFLWLNLLLCIIPCVVWSTIRTTFQFRIIFF